MAMLPQIPECYVSMDHKVGGAVFFKRLVVMILVLMLLSFSMNTNGDDVEGEQNKKESFWLWQRLRSAYSVYSAAFSPSTYWRVAKALVSQAYTSLFPPNIESGDEAEAVAANNGAGEKVKEALAKSIGTSKSTLEDTAKSAADIAGETVHKAKEMVMKRSGSESSEGKPHHQNEL